MHPFRYTQALDTANAIATVSPDRQATYIAGGTSLLDLMKLNVQTPTHLIDINALLPGNIEALGDGVRIGALARNSDVAAHPFIKERFPLLSEALLAGATPQLRNAATIGGNLLQRTRCSYFRDTATPCNKREPGSGCSALAGYNREHAILGGSAHCIATHPSDMCVALIALDAVVQTQSPKGVRTIPIADLYLLPEDHPERETVLEHGELVVAVDLPASPFAAHSRYVKVRDRASYAFAVVSIAVALDIRDGIIRAARIALGGVATKPWRAYEAEEILVGQSPHEAVYRDAANVATRGAKPQQHNAFKIELTQRTIVRALLSAETHDTTGHAGGGELTPLRVVVQNMASGHAGGGKLTPLRVGASVIGQARDRVDGRVKVTGAARYTAEISVADLVHAVVVQSTIARGRIILMETEEAEAVPGVLAVITYRNAPKLFPAPIGLADKNIMAGSAAQSYMPLQDDVIYHNGQHIGIVVAQTLEQATYAASLIRVQYACEQPLVSMQEELAHAFTPDNVWGEPPNTLRGNIEQGLTQADVRVDQTYVTSVQHHNTMEPHATIAIWEGDTLTLYESTTWVYGVRKTVSCWFNMPEEKIRVVEHFVGGSFGCKGPTWPHVALAAAAAQRVGRPVKLVLTRQQAFTSVGYRPEIHHHIQLGATHDGRLTALAHEAVAQTSIFDKRVVAPVTNATKKLYNCPNVATAYRLVHLNVGGPFTMRGPGETPGLFAIETAMDELAYELHIDPIDLRLRNYAEVDPEDGHPWSCKSLRECYRQGAARFGWAKRNPEPRSMHDSDFMVGWGMAGMAYDAKFAPASAVARLFADGTVLVQSATCDQGTGSYTIMCQIAAATLGVPFRQVRFELGDTQMPIAPISAGSMTAASVGSAVQAATTALRHKILSMAVIDAQSPLYQQSEEQVITENGRCFLKEDASRGEMYVDILKRHTLDKVEATIDMKPDPTLKQYTAYAFGAHFAEVHVRRSSGEVRVNRYVGAFSAGRILNAKTAHSQLLGGIVWGIGMALMEQTILDPHLGRIVNANLGEYHVPVHADIPPIEAFFVEEHDAHVNPLGAKGIGEIGTIGSAAAIANAVYHATGKRVRNLPITLDKLDLHDL